MSVLVEANKFAACHFKSLIFNDKEGAIGLIPSTQTATANFEGKPHPEYLPENYQQYFVASKNYSRVEMEKIADHLLDTLSKLKQAKGIHLGGADFYMVILDRAEKLKELGNLTLLTVRVEQSSNHNFNPAVILVKLPQVARFEISAGEGISMSDLISVYNVQLPDGYHRVEKVEGSEDKIVFAKSG